MNSIDTYNIHNQITLPAGDAQEPYPLLRDAAALSRHTIAGLLQLWYEGLEESVKEPEECREFESASSFIQPVCAASAKQGRLAAPENGRSMTASVKPSTRSTYAYQMERALIPRLGSKIAEEFDEPAMSEFLRSYREESGKNGVELSDSTLYLLEVIVRRAFIYAAEQGILAKNPLGKIQTRPCGDARLSVLTLEAVEALKRKLAAESPLNRLEILLPLYTGCILSELCAVSWQETDLEQGELYIRKQLLRVKETRTDSRTKTVLQMMELEPEKQRIVHIPKALCKELADLKSLCSTKRAYLLTGTEVCPDPRTYQKHVRATLARCGLENGSLTMLRDTYVVMCLECGAGEYSLARQLGVEMERLITRYQEYLKPDYGFVEMLSL